MKPFPRLITRYSVSTPFIVSGSTNTAGLGGVRNATRGHSYSGDPNKHVHVDSSVALAESSRALAVASERKGAAEVPEPSPPGEVHSRKKNVPDVFGSHQMKEWKAKFTTHTRDKLPKTDKDGLVMCFSQGLTDFCWKEHPLHKGVKVPVVLKTETTFNKISLFGMPKGYPRTTAKGFQHFFYLSLGSSFVSNFASSIGYQSLLNGFFVGSSPQLWMLKDLAPALFAAYMANRVVSYENRPKFWFVVSVFMNNVSVISDMIIPSVFPNYLLAAAVVTSTIKQSSALMFFVTRAAALQHFAINNNLAELTKKMNSFGMVVYTVATASGILFCSLIPSFTVQLTTVVVCCALNGILSSKSMSPIAFRILNFTTMSILMQEFCSTKRVLSPYDVSDRLGVRMLPKEKCCEKDKSSIVYISPPVDKLVIRADRLEEDILYVSDDNMFMLSLWEADEGPLSLRECYARYEFSSFMKYVKSFPPFKYFARKEKPDPLFGRKKLTLLVHVKCPVQHLITAHLLLSVSTIQHATSETELRLFLRQCHVEQKKWQAEGVRLRKALEDVGWDVSVPALDHPNYRLTDLIIPLSLRGTAPSPQK